jgi:hypothetical protein
MFEKFEDRILEIESGLFLLKQNAGFLNGACYNFADD